ncbi:MAG: hypothetical protein KAR42_16220 [candidate division Zixibacteria bacterium]|nr:hypothetical protein [candidate division Zixibacteria bacterium]
MKDLNLEEIVNKYKENMTEIVVSDGNSGERHLYYGPIGHYAQRPKFCVYHWLPVPKGEDYVGCYGNPNHRLIYLDSFFEGQARFIFRVPSIDLIYYPDFMYVYDYCHLDMLIDSILPKEIERVAIEMYSAKIVYRQLNGTFDSVWTLAHTPEKAILLAKDDVVGFEIIETYVGRVFRPMEKVESAREAS